MNDFSVIVVDNGSSDDSVELLRNNFPDVSIISNQFNTGFAKAVNDGIRLSLKDESVSHILLLNNDIECDRYFLEEMSKGFIDSSVASVACKMLNFYNRDILDDTGDFLRKGGLSIQRGYGEKDTGQYDSQNFIFSACAGAAMYKRDVFEIVGFFDEDFFAYLEDIDFGFRMQLSGFKCYYNPKAVCYHMRSATTIDKKHLPTYFSERNIIFLRFKNYPLGILLKYFLHFNLGRIRRFYIFARYYSLELALNVPKGYFAGIIKLPKMYSKRKFIQKNRKVSNKYINSILLDIKISDLKIKEKNIL